MHLFKHKWSSYRALSKEFKWHPWQENREEENICYMRLCIAPRIGSKLQKETVVLFLHSC